MKHNASKLTDMKECLADLSCDNLECSVKLYLEAKEFDVKLGTYQLSSPNGLLAAVRLIWNWFLLFFSSPSSFSYNMCSSYLLLIKPS